MRPIVIVLLVMLAVPPASAQVDPFLETHAEGTRTSNGTYRLTIRLAAGRAVFSAGEPIGLELDFDPPSVSPDVRESPCGGWMLAEAVIDPADAVALPGSALCTNFAEHALGGVLGCGVGGGLIRADGTLVERSPLVLKLTLNGPYRLTRPGRYRLFVRSRHAAADATGPDLMTSNVIAFEVRPADAEDEGTRVRAAVAQLDRAMHARGPVRVESPCGGQVETVRPPSPSEPPVEALAALDSLRAAGTREAAHALAARYRPMPDERVSSVDEWLRALNAVQDCRAAVDALDRELRDPERPIDGAFVRDHAALVVACRSPDARGSRGHSEFLQHVVRLGTIRGSVLAGRPGRLEATIREELAAAARTGLFLRGSLGAVIGHYPRETSRAFRTLASREQLRLLDASWQRFAHPVFVPLLRTVYRKAEDDELRDIALRRWFQLAPAQARFAILAELRRAEPRVATSTLALLADRALPSLEREWVDLLERSSSEAVLWSAAARLSRYGTRDSAARVARIRKTRLRHLSVRTDAAVLGFLARVDARRAGPLLLDAVRTRGVPPSALAAHGWTREVEAAATVALHHSSRATVVDAARTLAEHGSAAVRGDLQEALRRAHQAAARLTEPPGQGWTDEHVEGELAEALANARAWWLTPDDRRRLRGSCVSRACRQALTLDSRGERGPHVWFSSPHEPNPVDRMYFDGLRVRSIDALVRKLRQLPSGTAVEWRDRGFFLPELEQWTLAERDALLRRVQRRVADAGITLGRWSSVVSPPER